MNFLESILPAEFLRAFALTLFHSLWQGALLAVLAGGIMLLLRKHRPAIRYLSLYTLLMLMPMLFIGTFLLTYNTGNEQHHLAASASGIIASTGNPATEVWNDSPGSITGQVGYAKLVSFFESQANGLVMLWFAGFIIFLIRFSGSVFYVYRLKTLRTYPVSEYWDEHLRNLSERMGLRKSVRLAESALARIPMTIGYLKPVILLPVGTLSGVPVQQIEAILLHELAHILRKDYLLNIFQSLVELLLFYHPLTWWLSGLIRQEREHICDDMAISVNQDHINYIKALTTMEELNSKSPLLASAITGSKKKLLQRMKRLLLPANLRKGFSQGIIAFIFLAGLIFILSLNALSVIPSSFDLKGRESGEKVFNLLPFNPENIVASLKDVNSEPQLVVAPVLNPAPDSIVTSSRSGKVVMKLYTDSTGSAEKERLQFFVETLDNQIARWEQMKDWEKYYKDAVMFKENAKLVDSLRKVIIIKSGDSTKIVRGNMVFSFPEGYDTSIVTEGGFIFYGSDFPEMPEFPEIPDMNYYNLNEDEIEWVEQYKESAKDYEHDMREYEGDKKMLEKELKDSRVIVMQADSPDNRQWTPKTPQPPESNTVRIFRQELRDDGLTMRGKKYVIELDSKAMYINGEKQPKDVYRKYRKLLEGFEPNVFAETGSFKLIF
jgi:beta-lactamase regulating signal transducer with metallopeptidase domain